MTVAVIGGTGVLGRALVDVLRSRGNDVRAVSRHAPDYPADLTTGVALEAAVQGCEAVVDASNGPPSRKARRRLHALPILRARSQGR